jgi:hypothetical protein
MLRNYTAGRKNSNIDTDSVFIYEIETQDK